MAFDKHTAGQIQMAFRREISHAALQRTIHLDSYAILGGFAEFHIGITRKHKFMQ